MRNKKGMSTQILWLIAKLHEAGIPVSVKTLVTKINQNDIFKIGHILSRLPIEYWSLLEFNPINRGMTNKNKFYLNPKKFDSIVAKMKKSFPQTIIKDHQFVRKPDRYCFIASNGDVYRYVVDSGDELVGNLFDKGLGSILALI